MLTLDLNKLFTPQLLQAFRETWGTSPADADRLAIKIAQIFEENKGGAGNPIPRARRQAWLRTVVAALVGPEPDFEAWVEALTRRSFDVRPGVTYAHSKKAGSPSRFLRSQRKMIDRLVDKDLPPDEQELQQRAYLDALRQILVSLIILEMKRANTAKAAIGLAWPLMLAVDEDMSDEAKRLLHHFGNEPGFRKLVAGVVETAIDKWISTHCDGVTPQVPKGAFTDRLPPGLRKHGALVQLDRETAAVDEFRTALWREFGMPNDPSRQAGNKPNLERLAAADAATIKAARGTPAGKYRYFTEANDGSNPFEYEPEDLERLREYLPILANSAPESELVRYGRFRAEMRAEMRENGHGSQADRDLQEEIAEWVEDENPPPAKLKKEHAAYFEEEVCRHYVAHVWACKSDWRKLGFSYPDYVPL